MTEDSWISVDEEKPIGKGQVLLYTTSKMIYMGDLYGDQWRVLGAWNIVDYKWVSDLKFNDVTHWQPLPPPPKAKTNNL